MFLHIVTDLYATAYIICISGMLILAVYLFGYRYALPICIIFLFKVVNFRTTLFVALLRFQGFLDLAILVYTQHFFWALKLVHSKCFGQIRAYSFAVKVN